MPPGAAEKRRPMEKNLPQALRESDLDGARVLLKDDSALHALLGMCGHAENLCVQTAALLFRCSDAQALARLRALYTRLQDRMFPPEGMPAPALEEQDELYLLVLESLFAQKTGPFDPLTDLLPLEESEPSRFSAEYRQFCAMVRRQHLMALLRIGREIQPFDPASHTIGVHNVALHTGIFCKKAGLPVDLPLLRAAAFGHDIGKFGCRGEESARVPYLHYYYTWQWFCENGMENIGHISANHSTWDLEFENLPLESLLLIYADFRVRGRRLPDGREHMEIHTLQEAGALIFSKLSAMTEEKSLRYRTVYTKLLDFEKLLLSCGVPVQLDTQTLRAAEQTDASLLNAEQALERLRQLTLLGSVRLMHTISTDHSLELLLERARSEKNLQGIRTYLLLLEEYSTYMTRSGKQKTLALLYELLMHPDGDVRRTAGRIMGRLLANSGPRYRKERPAQAHADMMTPAMTTLLSEAAQLWRHYMELCLQPDRKISPKHAMRISNSLKIICQTLFSCCEEKQAAAFLEPLAERTLHARGEERFVLLDAMCHVPEKYLSPELCSALCACCARMLPDAEVRLVMMIFRCLEHLSAAWPLPESARAQLLAFTPQSPEYAPAIRAHRARLLGLTPPELSPEQISQLHLSNLKNSVHWTVKLEQLRMLCAHVRTHRQSAFHTALHLSNLLSVSEHLPVREAAGEQLLEIAAYLSVDQINEISIDLTRELETGQEQISFFVAPYLGRLLCRLPEKELSESLSQLEELTRGASVLPAQAALRTLGRALCALPAQAQEARARITGMLLTGVSHYEASIHQTALCVLCRDVLADEAFDAGLRRALFASLHKKLLCLLCEAREGELAAFNRAAMLNHLYRFLVRQEVLCGPFQFPPQKPAAFFPGTFDPFSAGHKQIVGQIRALGFEVYLAVDEFSWSKKTLPKLLRRQIVCISVADQPDTYLFPDDIPINIAMPEDLARLRTLLPQRGVSLVAGSDVILGASAYREEQPGGAGEYDHIVFCREGSADRARLEARIHGKCRILSLPPFYETVSSTRIRASIDRKLDISMLVDPVVQTLIYARGFYVRSPESKSLLQREQLSFRLFTGDAAAQAPAELRELLASRPAAMAAALFAEGGRLLAWALGRSITLDELYGVLGSLEAAGEVRRHASGRIIWIEHVKAGPQASAEQSRLVLNELLARSLARGNTYALCRCGPDAPLRQALDELGFLPLRGAEEIYLVDMRAPVMLLQDAMLCIKKPHHDEPAVIQAVKNARPRLRQALGAMFPGKLLLCFDSELLNQTLVERIERANGVQDVPPGEKRLGPFMCVPYGKIFSDEIVPNTVTKTLHVEKCFSQDLRRFEILEYPGYSPLRNQVRTLKSFHRPILLVDDLLHRGYRIDKLDEIFKSEELRIQRIIVALMSGWGQDLMRVQGRDVECEYFIPNLHYWVTESLLYPFIGGDSVAGRPASEHMLPSVNLLLPYCYPNFFADAPQACVQALSRTALSGALEIMRALEQTHQALMSSSLTLRRLSEALQQPRLPDKSRYLQYDFSLPASFYLAEDLAQIDRICRKE